MAMDDWIGTVLAALGNHIRGLEDENGFLRRELQYLRDMREGDRDGTLQVEGADPGEGSVAACHEQESKREGLA